MQSSGEEKALQAQLASGALACQVASEWAAPGQHKWGATSATCRHSSKVDPCFPSPSIYLSLLLCPYCISLAGTNTCSRRNSVNTSWKENSALAKTNNNNNSKKLRGWGDTQNNFRMPQCPSDWLTPGYVWTNAESRTKQTDGGTAGGRW